MPILFPADQPSGTIWSPDPSENPYNLVFVYDKPTNSWQIVGPDNLATTDYVDSKLTDSTSDTKRNYHLHTNVNQVSITGYWVYNQTGIEVGQPPNDKFACDEIYDRGMFARMFVDNPPKTYEEAQAIEVPDWHDCMSYHLTAGNFNVVGYDPDEKVVSYQFQHVNAFHFSTDDGLGDSYSWLADSHEGDILEVNYIGGDGKARYAIYEILEITEHKNKAKSTYGLHVVFRDSATPEEEFVKNPSGTGYEFRNYLQPINTGGGKISGPIKIVYDDESTFSVWKSEKDKYERLFNLDTTDSIAKASENHNLNLMDASSPKNHEVDNLITLGYFQTMMGITPGSAYDNKEVGKFLQLRGGDMSGTLTIKRSTSNGTGIKGFNIKGRNSSANNYSMFYAFYDNSAGDSVRYKGPYKNDDELVVKKRLDATNKDLADNYLSRSTTANNKNRMKVELNMGDQKIVNLATPTDDKPKHAANVEFVQSKMSGKINNGYLTGSGLLYELDGVLYYNRY